MANGVDLPLLSATFASVGTIAGTEGHDAQTAVAVAQATATLARTEAHDTSVAVAVFKSSAVLTRTETADSRALVGHFMATATMGFAADLETHDGLAGVGHFSTIAGPASVKVEWFYPPTFGARRPTGFHIYIGAGVPDYTTVAATVAYSAGFANSFQTTLANLVDGITYTIGVRAFNLVAEETNTATVTVTADSTGPLPVTTLTATAVV